MHRRCASASTSRRAKSWCGPPRGFPADFEFIDDLKHRNWVMWRSLDDATMTGPRLLSTLGKDLAGLGPFVDYLCAALDLEF
jgi:uncharacterized protein (DUF2461 family)